MSTSATQAQAWRPVVVRRARDAAAAERRLERAQVLALRGYEEHKAAEAARRERQAQVWAAKQREKLLAPLYLAIKALLRCVLRTAAKVEREAQRELERKARAAKRKARRRRAKVRAKPAAPPVVRTLDGVTVVVEKPPTKPKRGKRSRRRWRRPRAATRAGTLDPSAMAELALEVAQQRCEARRPGNAPWDPDVRTPLAPKLLAALYFSGEQGGAEAAERAKACKEQAFYGKPLAGGIEEWTCYRDGTVQEAWQGNAAELAELGDDTQVAQVQAFEHGLGAIVQPSHSSMVAARLFAGNGASNGKAPSTAHLGWAWQPQPARSSWGRSRRAEPRTLTLDAKLLPRPEGRGCLLF